MKFTTLILLAGICASVVNANVFCTSPFAAVTWNGGKVEKVTWKEDDKKTPPLLKDIPDLVIQLMTGNTQQVVVATISKGVAGTTQNANFKVSPNLGPPGNFYFIKFSSAKTNYFAFSGRFSIQGINGSIKGFNPNATITDPNQQTPAPNNSTDSSNSTDTTSPTNSNSTSSPTSQSSNKPHSAAFSLTQSSHLDMLTTAFTGLILVGYALSYLC